MYLYLLADYLVDMAEHMQRRPYPASDRIEQLQAACRFDVVRRALVCEPAAADYSVLPLSIAS